MCADILVEDPLYRGTTRIHAELTALVPVIPFPGGVAITPGSFEHEEMDPPVIEELANGRLSGQDLIHLFPASFNEHGKSAWFVPEFLPVVNGLKRESDP